MQKLYQRKNEIKVDNIVTKYKRERKTELASIIKMQTNPGLMINLRLYLCSAIFLSMFGNVYGQFPIVKRDQIVTIPKLRSSFTSVTFREADLYCTFFVFYVRANSFIFCPTKKEYKFRFAIFGGRKISWISFNTSDYQGGMYHLKYFGTRFGKKYYYGVYDGSKLFIREANTSQSVSGPIKTNYYHRLFRRAGDKCEIFGPLRIAFTKAEYSVGSIADAGITLTYFSSGVTSFELFSVENLNNPFEELSRISFKNITDNSTATINFHIHKNHLGINNRITLDKDERLGYQYNLFDANIQVGDTEATEAWLALIESGSNYEYFELASFNIVQPPKLNCEATEIIKGKNISDDIGIIMMDIFPKKNCYDLVDVSVNVQAELTASKVEFAFEENSYKLSQKQEGTTINLFGTIKSGYRVKFNYSVEFPPGKSNVFVYTNIAYKTMRHGKLVDTKQEKTYELKGKDFPTAFKRKVDHKKRKVPEKIPEISIVKFKNGFLSCNVVSENKNSGCYLYYLKHLKVIKLNQRLLSVLGINEITNNIFGRTVTSTVVINAERNPIEILSKTAYEEEENKEGFLKAKTFSRDQVFEKKIPNVLTIDGVPYSITYYGIYNERKGHHVFVWLPSKDCGLKVAKKAELALASCNEVRRYCSTVKSGVYWMRNMHGNNKIRCTF